MKKVAVIDSGSGGINVLKKLFKDCNGCKFLYLADEKHAPYGEKTPHELTLIAKDLTEFLINIFSPDIIVLACNTLTAVAIERLRTDYPSIVFIGCEPAIKPACQKYEPKNVLLLATPVTIEQNKLLKKYPLVRKLAIKNLPSLIDQNLFDLDVLSPLLKEQIGNIKPKAIVLGCTHFEAIKNQLCALFDAELFGSSEGIAKRLNKFLSEAGGNDVSFMTTGNGENLPKFFHYFLL